MGASCIAARTIFGGLMENVSDGVDHRARLAVWGAVVPASVAFWVAS